MSEKTIEEISSRIDKELNTFELYKNYIDSSLNILKSLSDNKKEDEKSIESMLRSLGERYIENQIIPKYFLNSLIITLYSIFENVIKEISEYYRFKKSIELKLKDINGKNFLDQASKYFNKVLKLEFCEDHSQYEKLKEIALLRNIFAHSNSSYQNIKNETTKVKLDQLMKNKSGIRLLNDDILISKSFLDESFNALKNHLNYLCKHL